MIFLLISRRGNAPGHYLARKQGLPTDPALVHYIESWAVYLIVPPHTAYIQVNMEIQQVLQELLLQMTYLPLFH